MVQIKCLLLLLTGRLFPSVDPQRLTGCALAIAAGVREGSALTRAAEQGPLLASACALAPGLGPGRSAAGEASAKGLWMGAEEEVEVLCLCPGLE